MLFGGCSSCCFVCRRTLSRLASLGKWMVVGVFDPNHEETPSFKQVSGAAHIYNSSGGTVFGIKPSNFSVEDNAVQLLCLFFLFSFWRRKRCLSCCFVVLC